MIASLSLMLGSLVYAPCPTHLQDPLYPFVCSDCKAGFNAVKALHAHRKEAHKVREAWRSRRLVLFAVGVECLRDAPRVALDRVWGGVGRSSTTVSRLRGYGSGSRELSVSWLEGVMGPDSLGSSGVDP